MSINLELNIDQLSSEELKMHYIPAKIDSNVSANVDNYFNIYTKEEKAGYFSNSLRGYREFLNYLIQFHLSIFSRQLFKDVNSKYQRSTKALFFKKLKNHWMRSLTEFSRQMEFLIHSHTGTMIRCLLMQMPSNKPCRLSR